MTVFFFSMNLPTGSQQIKVGLTDYYNSHVENTEHIHDSLSKSYSMGAFHFLKVILVGHLKNYVHCEREVIIINHSHFNQL